MEILERIQAGTQYRSMMLEAHDDKRMIVEGYAATFNQRYRLYDSEQLVILEQIDSRAFDKTNLSDVILQYNHEGRVFARTRNKTLQVTPNARGLFIRADLSGTAEGRKLYQEIKGGYTDRMCCNCYVKTRGVSSVTEPDDRIRQRAISTWNMRWTG